MTIEANRWSGWRMRPGEVHDSYGATVRVNALGLRGPEVVPKRAGERRVVFLGASLLYGEGVEEPATLTARFERELAEQRPDLGPPSVVNTGHRAYGLGQQVGLLEELGELLRPDLLICTWCWVNLADNDVEAANRSLLASGPISYGWNRIVEASDPAWRLRRLGRRSALAHVVHDLAGSLGSRPAPAELTDERLTRFAAHLDRLVALCERLDCRLAFVELPPPGALLGPHPSDPEVARALEHVRARHIPILEVKAALADLARRRGAAPTLPFDGHYDAEAYATAARALVRDLAGREDLLGALRDGRDPAVSPPP